MLIISVNGANKKVFGILEKSLNELHSLREVLLLYHNVLEEGGVHCLKDLVLLAASLLP